jgi:hypothetical protein
VRKLLALFAVLALLVVPAVPALAADTDVTAVVATPSITVTAPDNINLGTFTAVNAYNPQMPADPATGAGDVTVTDANDTTTWNVTTSASNNGYLTVGNTGNPYLANQLEIWGDGVQGWRLAGTEGLTYGSNPEALPFAARQYTVAADYNNPGNYVITITFTGNITW